MHVIAIISMDYDISKPVSQGSYGTQDAENSQADVDIFEVEQRAAEELAKSQGFWIPMMDVFDLGVPGPSGNENDTYVADKVIYKVNNLLNSGCIRSLLNKILLHNIIFPDTAYKFHGFAGFDGRTIQPVIVQPRIANAKPATQIMIDTYMAALDFNKTDSIGRFTNNTYEVWDIVPRNVLIDQEGDIYVIDAEIKHIRL